MYQLILIISLFSKGDRTVAYKLLVNEAKNIINGAEDQFFRVPNPQVSDEEAWQILVYCG